MEEQEIYLSKVQLALQACCFHGLFSGMAVLRRAHTQSSTIQKNGIETQLLINFILAGQLTNIISSNSSPIGVHL